MNKFLTDQGFAEIMEKMITEGLAKIKSSAPKIVSKEMDVFYNPVMSLNRDISVLMLNSANKKGLQIADPLAASGIRSIRFLKELNRGIIKRIYINDIDKKSIISIRDNFKINNLKIGNKKAALTNQDANLFLLNSKGFDYIDIDPFGSPNFMLDSASKRISRGGILAVTATDTSALAGTFPNACIRKYWAVPKKGPIMHEIGLRILIRKIQLIGAQFDKTLIPIFCYSKEHYMRVFLKAEKRKAKADKMLKQHGMLDDAGPMWLGKLWDSTLCNSIYKNAVRNKLYNKNKELVRFLEIIKNESKINSVGFYDLHDVCEKNKIKALPRKEEIKKKIRKLGYQASDTHFKGEGIRSGIPIKNLLIMLKK